MDHQRVQGERAEFVATLDRLAPAWRELRSVLNELNRTISGAVGASRAQGDASPVGAAAMKVNFASILNELNRVLDP